MDKKALSEMVGYVLLIVIAISLSILVYSFLKSYILVPQEKCHDGVNLIVDRYTCDENTNEIIIEMKNMGTFSAYGFIIRAGNKSEGNAIYALKAAGETAPMESDAGKILLNERIVPDSSQTFKFTYSSINRIEKIDIEPIEIIGGNILLCEDALASQKILGCG